MNILQAVRIAQVVQGIQNGSYEITTFYEATDFWRYVVVSDDKLCSVCQVYENVIFQGIELKTLFPYLTIEDADTINVNVHMPRDPWCRCQLKREVI